MSTTKTTNDLISFYIPLAIALGNVALFGLMFFAMNYFELIGADPAYFDDGTIQNLKYINAVSGIFGIEIDPTQPHKISTLMYALCLGVALVSTAFAIMLANRRPSEAYEVTEAKQ